MSEIILLPRVLAFSNLRVHKLNQLSSLSGLSPYSKLLSFSASLCLAYSAIFSSHSTRILSRRDDHDLQVVVIPRSSIHCFR
jgi:hypothetical protein